MLSGKKLEWADIRKKLMEPTFIASVVNYDAKKQLSAKIRTEVQKSYLSDESKFSLYAHWLIINFSFLGFKYEQVNRASKACGPMCKWVTANTFYSDIFPIDLFTNDIFDEVTYSW